MTVYLQFQNFMFLGRFGIASEESAKFEMNVEIKCNVSVVKAVWNCFVTLFSFAPCN